MIVVSRRRPNPVFEDIGIHDPPLLFPRDVAEPFDFADSIAELAGHQDFVFGADISPRDDSR